MRCAVLGDPVGHSLSPVLHRAGYAVLGLDWTYDAHRVPSGGLAGFLAGLDDSWRGLSVTMPLKREAAALATTLSDRAARAGAANTLLLAGAGVLGDNTDTPGAVAAVRERYDGAVEAGTVLGGGATAASLGLALCDLGATSVTLLVRSPERASAAATAIAAHPARPAVAVGSLATGEAVGDVLVSTIPPGAQHRELVERCAVVPVVFEATYDPWPTPLAEAARTSGRVLVSGLDLLVHQAALQFTTFTGHDAPLDAMRAAGEASLAER